MNSVNIIGNIGHDLELRYTGSGKPVLNLSIAVSNFNGESEWFRVVIWNAVAENTVKYCKKGSKIGVSGRLATNKYTDNNGQERTNTEIVAQQVEFLSYQNEHTPQENQYSGQNNANQGQQTYNNGQNNSPTNQNNQNMGQAATTQNTGNPNHYDTFSNGNDPFQSNDNVTNISDDDLPF